MLREFYLKLAAEGLAMPIGTDLVLREKPDHEAIIRDGERLGRLLEEAARRWRSPLAFPLMDLTLEKHQLLTRLGVPAEQTETYHFQQPPAPEMLDRFTGEPGNDLDQRMRANVDAIRYIAQRTTLVPVGMSIGPFSLMTKLIADPITAVYLAGSGITANEDDEVLTVERTLEMSTRLVLESVTLQLRAGARAIFIAEPAANKVYFSPRQIEQEGMDLFDRYVIASNRRIRQRLEEHEADLIFHCCGELIDMMVSRFAELDPAILSLGSSRHLWEDARLVPKTTVLYGNLPSKQFYSDGLITRQDVEQRSRDLLRKMAETGHPFILGSECDVLSVPDAHRTIMNKVEGMIRAAGPVAEPSVA